MKNFSKNILSVDSLLGRMIDSKLFSLIYHFESLDVDVINTSVRKRSRDTGQIQTDKKFIPAVCSRRSNLYFQNKRKI